MINNYIIKNNIETINKIAYYVDKLNMIGGDSSLEKLKQIKEINGINLGTTKENLKTLKIKMEELNDELKKADKDYIIDTQKLKKIDESLKPLLDKINEYDSNVYKLEKIKIDEFDFNYINIKQNFNSIMNIYKNLVISLKDFKLTSSNEYEQINNKVNNSSNQLTEEIKALNLNITNLSNKIETDIENIKNIYQKSQYSNIEKYIISNDIVEKENIEEVEILNKKDLLTIMIPDRIKEIEEMTRYFLRINEINTKEKDLYNADFDISKYFLKGGKLLNKGLYNFSYELENLQIKMGKLNYLINYYEQLKIRYFYYQMYLGLLINKTDYLIYKTNYLEYKTIVLYKDLVNYITNNLRENELKYFGKYHVITLLKIDNFLNNLQLNLKDGDVFDMRKIEDNNLKIDSYLFSSFRKILDDFIIYKNMQIINRYILYKKYYEKNGAIVTNNWIKIKDYIKHLNFNKTRIYLQDGKIQPVEINPDLLQQNDFYNFDTNELKISKIDRIDEYINTNNYQEYIKYQLIKNIDSKIEELKNKIIYIEIINEKNKFLFVIVPEEKDILEEFKEKINSLELTSARKIKMKFKIMGIYFNPVVFALTNSDLILREFNKLEIENKRKILNTKLNINNKEVTFGEEQLKNIQIKNLINGTNIELIDDNIKYQKPVCVKLLYRILKLNNLKLIEKFTDLIIKNLDRYEIKYNELSLKYNYFFYNDFKAKILKVTDKNNFNLENSKIAILKHLYQDIERDDEVLLEEKLYEELLTLITYNKNKIINNLDNSYQFYLNTINRFSTDIMVLF
jgi:hypothetical protein